MEHRQLIRDFYAAFNNRDYKTMQSLYADNATFSDPAFSNLNAPEVRAMWQMLITSAKDLQVECSDVKADAAAGSCRWDAWYTFSATGRKVHNIIYARFQFKDGKIVSHKDDFDFWRWSRMALGVTGALLGWTPILKNKVQRTAMARLKNFMHKDAID